MIEKAKGAEFNLVDLITEFELAHSEALTFQENPPPPAHKATEEGMCAEHWMFFKRRKCISVLSPHLANPRNKYLP